MSEHTAEPAAVKRLERSRDDRMLAGVCGGLARYFGIHPAFYRVGFVVLTLLGGSGILVYLAAVLVIPKEGEPESIAAEALRNRRERPWPLIALSLLAVAGTVLLSRATVNADGDTFWVLLLLAGGVILWTTRRSSGATEDSRRVGRIGRIVAWTTAGILVLVIAALATFAAVFHVHLRKGVGDRTYEVANVQELRDNYHLGIGDMRVDLSDLQSTQERIELKTRVDVGKLTVIVPKDAGLDVKAYAQAGEVDLLGMPSSDGYEVDRTLVRAGTGKRTIVLNASVGAGQLHVIRAVR
jgi:phage shock protein PspC (stress-responsive transcriptional regulator)